MADFGSERTIETRDRLRLKLDILARYDRVLQAQLDALDADDLERFTMLSEEREKLGEQLTSVDARDEVRGEPDSDPMADLETARLMAEIHLRASELKVLDQQVLGALNDQRRSVKDEMERTSAPVSDGAVSYMKAESGPDGPDRLDVVL